jgi:hypothetical protein
MVQQLRVVIADEEGAPVGTSNAEVAA